MVKALFVGLLAATICGIVFSAPAIVSEQHQEDTVISNTTDQEPPPLQEEDSAARSERSTNLSLVGGTARKVRMFIKNRHLQILPDGTVNGTTDDTSNYTILQRIAVGKGQMRIQGVATCQYLCMDSCGFLYGSLEFGYECVFNETMELNNYNTYASTKYSNKNRTLYLALNRHGQPRKAQRARHQAGLGKLSSYTRVLLRTVDTDRVREIHPKRHHGCSTTLTHQNHHRSAMFSNDQQTPRCRKRKKKKKKKRKCQEDEFDAELCQKRHSAVKCEDNDNECQRDKEHKSNSDKPLVSVSNAKKKKKKNRKGVRKRLENENVSTEMTVTSTVTVTPDPADEDYNNESSTHIDWEDSTSLPEISMAVSDATRLTAEPHLDSD
ncbi:unnamed protein product [Brassicogethes aeneus]|uniref:Fibroblast growth factor n=1 Tax=Brassicogethes aeneus TaxID=1431903 RepID=A0A9P0FP91_BRAAE|nr:unnamed protein product [Brassicogethes aeneus]